MSPKTFSFFFFVMVLHPCWMLRKQFTHTYNMHVVVWVRMKTWNLTVDLLVFLPRHDFAPLLQPILLPVSELHESASDNVLDTNSFVNKDFSYTNACTFVMIFTPQRAQNVLKLFSEAENAKLLNEDLYKTWVSSKLVYQPSHFNVLLVQVTYTSINYECAYSTN